MKVGIVGSRRRDSNDDFLLVKKAFDLLFSSLNEEVTIVSGGAKEGGDSFAEILSLRYEVNFVRYKPLYRLYGKNATHVRNQKIADDSDILIAAVAEDRTGGTESTIKKFLRHHDKSKLVLI